MNGVVKKILIVAGYVVLTLITMASFFSGRNSYNDIQRELESALAASGRLEVQLGAAQDLTRRAELDIENLERTIRDSKSIINDLISGNESLTNTVTTIRRENTELRGTVGLLRDSVGRLQDQINILEQQQLELGDTISFLEDLQSAATIHHTGLGDGFTDLTGLLDSITTSNRSPSETNEIP